MPEQTPTPDNDRKDEVAEVKAHLAEAVLGLQKLNAEGTGAPGVAFSCTSCGIDSCNKEEL